MFGLLVFSSLAALVLSQDATTHAHHIHAAHSTDLPLVDHTFKDTKIVFYKDLPNKAMILKSSSGCYVTHLNDKQVEEISDMEKLLHIEATIIHHIRNAHHFHMAQDPDHYSTEIKNHCPKLYVYHKEH
ncbi:uncharacterized protein LOC135466322 [Liolophura sinensis]|uniref:uncharacterized protein LOC135466322 n=1 Tax=Liolophura sinensis TaxID=3198878 RepID=UPI003158AF5B